VHVQGGGARKLPERAGACARGAADSRVDRTGGHRLLRAPERHAICRLIIRLALPLSLSVCFKHSGLFLHWIDPLNRRPSTINAAGTFVLVHGTEALVLDAQRGESFIG
jgi:hypothetical protein